MPHRVTASQQDLALAAASLLAPCALVAFTLTCWSVAADLGWTAGFCVVHGLFSHWQSWLILSVILLLVSRLLSHAVGESRSKY
jgi:hypothetical protein